VHGSTGAPARQLRPRLRAPVRRPCKLLPGWRHHGRQQPMQHGRAAVSCSSGRVSAPLACAAAQGPEQQQVCCQPRSCQQRRGRAAQHRHRQEGGDRQAAAQQGRPGEGGGGWPALGGVCAPASRTLPCTRAPAGQMAAALQPLTAAAAPRALPARCCCCGSWRGSAVWTSAAMRWPSSWPAVAWRKVGRRLVPGCRQRGGSSHGGAWADARHGGLLRPTVLPVRQLTSVCLRLLARRRAAVRAPL